MSDAQAASIPHHTRESSRAQRKATQVAPYVKWISVVAIIGALFVLSRVLPVGRAIQSLETWLSAIGPAAPIVFGLIYILATVLLFPGSVLTIAAGMFFGLLWGTVTASLASTSGAAIAFLIGRYAARDAVARKVHQHPKTGAVDRAVTEGGWKIVALLRLSPAVPFNLQNYLYGITGIGFWQAVLTSWVAMLPGTFLYVYIGYVSREGLEAAGGTASVDYGRWGLLAVGLVATAALTVYLTKLARRKLAEQTEVVAEDEQQETAEAAAPASRAAGWPWKVTLLAGVAVAMVALAACATVYQQRIAGSFGPPAVAMREAYEQKPKGPSFDHSVFDGLLDRHVDHAGWVDYAELRKDADQLDRYIAAVAAAPFADLGRDEKLALLINAYNAFTLKLILEYWNEGQLESIKDIPADKRWADARWEVGAHTWSLNEMEHEQIRPKFKEPRIHFALVCAAVGCPPLRTESYVADRIDAQLEDQTRYVHNHETWFRFEPQANTVHLTPLYNWYEGDFEQTAGSVPEFAARYAPRLKEALGQRKSPKVRWLGYDWKLNSKRNRQPR